MPLPALPPRGVTPGNAAGSSGLGDGNAVETSVDTNGTTPQVERLREAVDVQKQVIEDKSSELESLESRLKETERLLEERTRTKTTARANGQ